MEPQGVETVVLYCYILQWICFILSYMLSIVITIVWCREHHAISTSQIKTFSIQSCSQWHKLHACAETKQHMKINRVIIFSQTIIISIKHVNILIMPIHKHDAINIQLTINKNVTLISGSIVGFTSIELFILKYTLLLWTIVS